MDLIREQATATVARLQQHLASSKSDEVVALATDEDAAAVIAARLPIFVLVVRQQRKILNPKLVYRLWGLVKDLDWLNQRLLTLITDEIGDNPLVDPTCLQGVYAGLAAVQRRMDSNESPGYQPAIYRIFVTLPRADSKRPCLQLAIGNLTELPGGIAADFDHYCTVLAGNMQTAAEAAKSNPPREQ